MSWLSDLFRKTLEDDAHEITDGDTYLAEMVRRVLHPERYDDINNLIPSGRASRRSGSGVDSPLRDTGAAFSPVAPVVLINPLNHRSGN